MAVIFYFSESGDRLKQKHYQAWQVINTAQGKGGSGGRIEPYRNWTQTAFHLWESMFPAPSYRVFVCPKHASYAPT